jgi:O-antigen/teichoic acid export membrane protein
MKDSLNKRYTIKLGSNIVSGIVTAMIIAIVPKSLGPIAYGQFVYLQDFFLKIISFLDMGSSEAFFIKLSARRERKELIGFYFFYALLLLTLLLSLVFLMDIFRYTSALLPNIQNDYIYMGLFFGFFTWISQIYIKISDAYALTVSVELVKIFYKFASFILLLGLVNTTFFNLQSYFYFNYVTIILFLSVLSWIFIKESVFEKNNFKLGSVSGFLSISKEFIRYCHPLLIYSVVGLIAGVFDIWLLQTVSGNEQVGFYGLAYSLAAVCFLFTSAMTPIFIREFSSLYEKKNTEEMRRMFYKYAPMLYAIAAYFGIFISMQSENIITIFADERFKEAYLALVIMAFYPLHQTYGQLSGGIMYATGQTKLIRNIGVLSMGIGSFLSFTLVFLFSLGAEGLAYKMLLGQIVWVNIQLYFNSKLLNFKMRYFVFHQFYAIVFFLVLAYLSSVNSYYNSPLLNVFFSGFIYTILTAIFIYAIPQVAATTREEIRKFLQYNFNKVKSWII